jgi:hypothetical protein
LTIQTLSLSKTSWISAKPTFKATWPNPKPTGETIDDWAHCESVRANKPVFPKAPELGAEKPWAVKAKFEAKLSVLLAAA